MGYLGLMDMDVLLVLEEVPLKLTGKIIINQNKNQSSL